MTSSMHPSDVPLTRRGLLAHAGAHRPATALSVSRLAASVIVAAAATVLASYFGVNATVIGGAIASLLAVAGSARLTQLIRHAHARVAVGPVVPPAEPGRSDIVRVTGRLLLGAAIVYAVVALAVTGVELGLGRPLSSAVRDESGHGATFGGTAQVTHAPNRP